MGVYSFVTSSTRSFIILSWAEHEKNFIYTTSKNSIIKILRKYAFCMRIDEVSLVLGDFSGAFSISDPWGTRRLRKVRWKKFHKSAFELLSNYRRRSLWWAPGWMCRAKNLPTCIDKKLRLKLVYKNCRSSANKAGFWIFTVNSAFQRPLQNVFVVKRFIGRLWSSIRITFGIF